MLGVTVAVTGGPGVEDRRMRESGCEMLSERWCIYRWRWRRGETRRVGGKERGEEEEEEER